MKYFCMKCGKSYNDSDRKSMPMYNNCDGCCFPGSLIELDHGRKNLLRHGQIMIQNGDITLEQLINLMHY